MQSELNLNWFLAIFAFWCIELELNQHYLAQSQIELELNHKKFEWTKLNWKPKSRLGLH